MNTEGPGKPYIPMVAPQDAEGELREAYARWTYPPGSDTANILRIHSLHPEALAAHMQLYTLLMRGQSPLSRLQREMIATAVSGANTCFY